MTTSEEKNTLWHYTTLEGLKGILTSQNLWATDYRYLNDSSELHYAKDLLRDKLLPRIRSDVESELKSDHDFEKYILSSGGLDNFLDTTTTKCIDIISAPLLYGETSYPPFILSFCNGNGNEKHLMKNGRLSQWRGYGKDGGYALIFNKDLLLEKFSAEADKYYYGISGKGDVIYNLETLKAEDEILVAFQDALEEAFKIYRYSINKAALSPITEDTISNIVSCATFIKHNGFSEEEEFRIYCVPFNEKIRKYPTSDDKKQLKKVFHKEKSGLMIPYINLFEDCKSLPIEAICIGPHKEKELRKQSIEEYLHELGLKHINVFSSEIPFIG